MKCLCWECNTQADFVVVYCLLDKSADHCIRKQILELPFEQLWFEFSSLPKHSVLQNFLKETLQPKQHESGCLSHLRQAYLSFSWGHFLTLCRPCSNFAVVYCLLDESADHKGVNSRTPLWKPPGLNSEAYPNILCCSFFNKNFTTQTTWIT